MSAEFERIKATLACVDQGIILADGFEEALIGHAQVFSNVIALYDREKCIQILMKRDGMKEEEAEEFFEFNVAGAYVGQKTPAFATIMRK